jgi:hypothetical protein
MHVDADCHSPASKEIVDTLCTGEASCSIFADESVFGALNVAVADGGAGVGAAHPYQQCPHLQRAPILTTDDVATDTAADTADSQLLQLAVIAHCSSVYGPRVCLIGMDFNLHDTRESPRFKRHFFHLLGNLTNQPLPFL